MKLFVLFLAGMLATTAFADPQLTSWFTANAGQYAKIQPTTGAATETTWTGQTLPAYADVELVMSSTDFIYVHASGLASHVMGPWYLNAAKTMVFPNKPTNQKATMRFPRSPIPAGTHTSTQLGAGGIYVNGMAFFNMLDGYSWTGSADEMGMSGGLGIWNRDADFAEVITFDNNNAHQPGSGQYHAHVNPLALRFQLDDNVIYNSSSNTYSETTNTLHHSPILGWAFDGYPIYGPYGYSVTNDPNSTVRRMVSGYVIRNGQYGTTNLNVTGRTSLPLWAQAAQGRTNLTAGQDGPSTNQAADMTGTFLLGRYCEDHDYLGDLPPVDTAGTQWDLDRYNGRNCVTPDFPQGTYAYFTTINSNGSAAFPYMIGRQYYGVASGGITNVIEAVVTNFVGGVNSTNSIKNISVDGSGDVTLTWSSIQGGTYTVSSSPDMTNWVALAPSITSTTIVSQAIESGAVSTYTNRFYKLKCTAVATFDP